MGIEQQFCDAVDILVDRAISLANFDKTVQATVQECVDETVGKYKVKFQNSVYYATADTSVKYGKNSLVYLLVPGGDFSKEKKIIGTVDGLGANYAPLLEGDDIFEYNGTNLIDKQGEFSISSFNPSPNNVKYLYKVNEDSLITVDENAAKEYLSESKYLIIAAKFRTEIEKENRNYGNYGICFGLSFQDDETGQSITKDFILDVDNMIGQPYNYPVYIRQTEEFEIVGENFEQIKYIYIFAKDFLKSKEDYVDDIFIKDIEISAATPLSDSELNSYYLSLITPQGTFFADFDTPVNELTLQAQLRVMGKVASEKTHNMQFYWFIEQAGVDSKNIYFNKYGGQGWKCLNNYNVIEGATDEEGNVISKDRIEWIPASSSYIVKKEDSLALKTKYKCVCIYEEVTISKEITIKNYDADYTIEIDSSVGVMFSYDHGVTDLTCNILEKDSSQIDKDEKLSYNYYWSKINSVGNYEQLDSTLEENQRYALAIEEFEEINSQIENFEVYPEETFSSFGEEYVELVESYIYDNYIPDSETPSIGTFLFYLSEYLKDSNILRIEDNKIYNLQAKTISNFNTYSCSVYQRNKEDGKDGKFIGNASITLTNSFDAQPRFTLLLHEGSQVFKYNENGVSPSHPSNENPLELKTLSFSLFDEQGQKIGDEALKRNCKVNWIIPKKNTLLKPKMPLMEADKIIENEDNKIYTDTLIFDYDIENSFNPRKTDNQIELEIDYKGLVLKTSTSFTFLKEGDSGTNGTSYSCRIVPNVADNEEVPFYPMLTFYSGGENPQMNYQIKGTGNLKGTDAVNYKNWFKVELWKDGEKIESGYTVDWSILKNKYNLKNEDSSSFTVKANGEFSVESYNSGHFANIVKASIEYEDKVYIATIPVITARIYNREGYQYQISHKDGTGFSSVIYSADGADPKYDSINPFEIQVIETKINETDETSKKISIDISQDSSKLDYEWKVLGAVYDKSSKKMVASRLLTANGLNLYTNNLRPAPKYDGLCVSVAIETIVRDAERREIGRIHRPIHFLLNRFGKSAINGWDGNSLSLDDEGGMILSPQVGAGEKNANNEFTGIIMGAVEDAADDERKVGLLGYHEGKRSIFLDAKTGKAEFGINNSGKIILDPTNNKAIITSGGYTEGTNGSGLKIDLTTPEIKYGNRKFFVTNEGHLNAQGGGKIAGWKIGETELSSGTTFIRSAGDYRFWVGAGKDNAASAPFYIHQDGSIKATKGTIGGWSIQEKYLMASDGSIGIRADKTDDDQLAFWAGSSDYNGRFSAPFRVNFKGRMVAESGRIGGWEIGTNKLTSTNNKATLSSTGEISGVTIKGATITGASIYTSNFYYEGSLAEWKKLNYVKSINGITVSGSAILTGGDKTVLMIHVNLDYTKATCTYLGFGGTSSTASQASEGQSISITHPTSS